MCSQGNASAGATAEADGGDAGAGERKPRGEQGDGPEGVDQRRLDRLHQRRRGGAGVGRHPGVTEIAPLGEDGVAQRRRHVERADPLPYRIAEHRQSDGAGDRHRQQRGEPGDGVVDPGGDAGL